jgi:beta-galactosidase
LDQYSAWGQKRFYDLHLIGYINETPVAEQWIASSQVPHRLELSTDTRELRADGADMTRLIVRITDRFGNPLPYSTSVVTFELTGEADLVGENPFPLIGGQAALFIRAGRQPGEVTVRAQAAGLPPASLTLKMIPA